MPLTQRTFFQNYLSTEGRIGRCDYWLRGTVLALISILAAGATWIVWEICSPNPDKPFIVMCILFLLWLLIAGYSSLCISAQRAHDLGRSGWVGFAGDSGGLLGFYLAIGSGDEGPNKYGEAPPEPSQIKINLTVFLAFTTPVIGLVLWGIHAWGVLTK